MTTDICTDCDYLNIALDMLSKTSLPDDHLVGVKVWICSSAHDELSIKMRNLYTCVFDKLGVNIVDADFNAIKEGRIDCDIVLMFTFTAGTSARAIEIVVTSKFQHSVAKLMDKLYVCMPTEYSRGYISRKLSSCLIAGKIYHKYKRNFDELDKNIFSKCVAHLADIVNDKKEEMKVTFKPTILIVTALPLEFTMMVDLLAGKRHDPSFGDHKSQYPHGIIGTENVVVAMSGMGNNFSSAIATKALDKYPSVKYIFMTGIAGGVPYIEIPNEHVRLGDLVICNEKGVVQHDMGKSVAKPKKSPSTTGSKKRSVHDDFEYNFLPRPPDATLLRNTLIYVTHTDKGNYDYWSYLDDLSISRRFVRPDKMDLRDSPWLKKPPQTQPEVPEGFDVSRPRIHFGVIASGNSVVKNSNVRDKLKKDFKVKAIEMEASGVSDATWLSGKDYFIIRGICDYANPDKNKEWQPYAAAAAASLTREIIEKTLGNNN